MALTRHSVDDPLRAMHEAQVLRQVVAELREAAEWYEMPEAATTPALEEPLAYNAHDGSIRRSVVRNLQPGGPHDPEALESPWLPELRVRRHPRIRTGVDQGSAGCENPVYLG